MKFTEFAKREILDWKPYELLGLLVIFALILNNIIFLNDSIIAVISAICGILYTILAGKGKIYCYLFGLLGSGCYITISFLI
jgi:nicotinamide mononucleotide transporter